MSNSHDATPTTKSCFSGILRRLLCTGSLPTHPSDSDHLPDFGKADFINYLPKKNEHEVQGGGGTVLPGVVARLMGLDSLPADMTWVPNKDSIRLRSRSVNSGDYWSPLDLTAQESYRHRRVRTSASFREIPTTFLVCFDKNGDEQIKTSGDEGLKMMAKVATADQVKRISKTKISTTSSGGNKWNTKEKVIAVKKKKKKENRENNKRKDDLEPKRQNNIVLGHNKSNDVYVRSSTMKMKRSAAKPVNLIKEEVSGGTKRAKQRVNRGRAKKVEPEQHSPVESGNSGTMAFNPAAKKNSTPKVVDKLYLEDYPCVNSVRKSNGGAAAAAEVDFYVDKLVEVCRITDEDTKASPNNWPWISSSRSDQVIEFEHICFDFGQEILEMLLQQLVDELNL